MTPNKKIAFLLERAHLLLKEYYGYESFLPLQKNIISDILNGRDTLAIMQTGAGKSICFHIPALLFDGITIIILPHNYTIRQKTDELTKKGIPVDYISADAKEIEIATTIKKIHQKYTKILYLAVEQLDLCLKIKIFENIDISLLIVDEAHCISPYGHDYKPTYQVIRKFIDCLPERPRLSAFSTTVATNIQKDIIKSLALGRTAIHISTFINENLFLDIKKEVKKNLFLQIYLKKNITKSGIIYASTPSIVENIYNFLKKKDFSIGLYHNDLTAKEQQKIQEDFLSNKINILVTTNTFFINPQKENIRYIIHYNSSTCSSNALI